MLTLAFYSIIATALFYIGSRAQITEPIWSRYPHSIAVLMDCPACIGFWHGVALSTVLGNGDDFTAMIPGELNRPGLAILTGLVMMVLTPITSAIMIRGLETVGSAVQPLDDNGDDEA